eukprot:1154568-Pelagomonas_calceolata.AAC.12
MGKRNCWAASHILLGVDGAIYSPHTFEPLKELGFDIHKVTKLALKLHAHSVQFAYKLTSISQALEKTLSTLIGKIRHGLLLVTLLISIDLFFVFLGGPPISPYTVPRP